jgi:hypothetical protein
MNFKELYDKGGELALKEISRKKPVLKDAVVVVAIDSRLSARSASRKRRLPVANGGIEFPALTCL